ncbi:MAG: DUF4382 domain-containing protein [Thaumarchaeota archaeon]|nr:DUF4382 domain-containing protein [Nitrososphaerota archaeon]
MAVIGILVAAAIIGGISVLNLPPGPSTTITSHETTTDIIVSTSTKTSTRISNSTIEKGTLVTQITDLLNLPAGVTHVYASYSDIEVHTKVGNFSAWLSAAPPGIADLTGLSNRSRTIAASNIASGTIDSVRFSITSALITFHGNNVSAGIQSQLVTVPITGRLALEPNGTSGFVLDIAPTIIPTQTGNVTYMELYPYAKAIAIPSSVPSSVYAEIGSLLEINSQPWFTSTIVRLADNVTIVEELLTPISLLLLVNNTGNSNVTINGISILSANSPYTTLETSTIVETVTTVTTITQIATPTFAQAKSMPAISQISDNANGAAMNAGTPNPNSDSGVPSSYQTVATFLVLSNKQLIQPSSIGQNGSKIGLTLAPGENASLVYIGKIATLNSIIPPYPPLSIIPGQPYLLSIEGPFGQSEDINVTAISPFG